VVDLKLTLKLLKVSVNTDEIQTVPRTINNAAEFRSLVFCVWLQHVQRMDTNRLPKQALQYKPKGRRNIGRPRKRWRDQLHLEDQGTGNTPNPSGT
jgi:hypothetical protein